MADAVDLGHYRQPKDGLFLPGVTMRFNGVPLDPTLANAFTLCRLSKTGEIAIVADSRNGSSEVIIIDGPAGQVRFVFSPTLEPTLDGTWHGNISYEKTDDTPATKHVVAKFVVEFYDPEGGVV